MEQAAKRMYRPAPGSRLCVGNLKETQHRSGCVPISHPLRSGANSTLLFTPVTSQATETMRSDTFLPLFFKDSVKKDGLFSFGAEMS